MQEFLFIFALEQSPFFRHLHRRIQDGGGGHHFRRKAFIFIETSEAITILGLAS